MLLLATIVGVAAGIVVVAAAGARRTDTAFDRLLQTTNAADLMIVGDALRDEQGSDLTEAEAGVEAIVDLTVFSGRFVTAEGRVIQEFEGNDNELGVVASADPRWMASINRPVVARGRLPHPDRPDEVVATREIENTGVRVGDTILVTAGFTYEDEPREADLRVRVVGVVIEPLGVRPAAGVYLRGLFGTPALLRDALDRSVPSSSFKAVVLGDDVPSTLPPGGRVGVGVDGQVPAAPFGVVIDMRSQKAAIAQGIEGDVVLLWLVALAGTLGLLMVLTPIVSHGEAVLQGDAAQLRLLGVTRRGLLERGVLHGLAVGAAAAVLATLTAVALSPLTPTGDARGFEPQPGLYLDSLVLLIAAVVVLTFVVVVTVAGAWIATRPSPSRVGHRVPWSSRASTAAPLGVSGELGVRMACEPAPATLRPSGHQIAVSMAIGLVTACVTFAAGAGQLRTHDELVGSTAQVGAGIEDGDPGSADRAVAWLLAQPEVAGASAGTLWPLGGGFAIGDEQRAVWLVSSSTGPRSIRPAIVGGRAPAGPEEVAVHPALLRKLGRAIGDVVTLHLLAGGEDGSSAAQMISRDYTVVGTTVVGVGASVFKSTAAVTFEGMRRLATPALGAIEPQVVFAELHDGVDPMAFVGKAARSGSPVPPLEAITPSGVDGVGLDLTAAERGPRVLSVLIGAMGAVVLLTMSATRAHAWRRELAVSRALGLSPKGVRWSHRFAALVSTLGCAAVGIPVGLMIGQRLWMRYATNLGVVPYLQVPWWGIGTGLVVGLLLAVACAELPGRLTARRSPARLLRAE
ncbi:MAG TPA: ABC transporter permease [Acidimicrobiales bacterium]